MQNKTIMSLLKNERVLPLHCDRTPLGPTPRAQFRVTPSFFNSPIIYLVLALICCLPLSGWGKNQIPDLSKPSVQIPEPPEISVKLFPNFLKVYTYEDRALPLFKATLWIQCGSAYEKSELAGLSSLLATLLATGGTKKYSPKELDAFLDEKGIQVSSGSDSELTWVTVSSLKEYAPEALQLLWELVDQPRLDKERFNLAKNNWIEDLKRQEDLPNPVAKRNLEKALYGDKNPWANIPTG